MTPRPIASLPNFGPNGPLWKPFKPVQRTIADDDEDRSAAITDAIALLMQAEDALAEGLTATCDQLMADAADLLLPVQA